MKRSILFIIAFLVFSGVISAQSDEFIGTHSGQLSWERLPTTIEIKANNQYVITTYDFNQEAQRTIKGQWRADGDRIVLTDVTGAETTLYRNNDEFYIVGSNGITCAARFYSNKALSQYMAERKSQGC